MQRKLGTSGLKLSQKYLKQTDKINKQREYKKFSGPVCWEIDAIVNKVIFHRC